MVKCVTRFELQILLKCPCLSHTHVNLDKNEIQNWSHVAGRSLFLSLFPPTETDAVNLCVGNSVSAAAEAKQADSHVLHSTVR